MNNPPPRDPLISQTLAVPESERTTSSVPEAYRLVRRACSGPDLCDPFKLQGAFKTYNAQGMLEFEWRDIPTVIED